MVAPTTLQDAIIALAPTKDTAGVWRSDAGIYLGAALLHANQGYPTPNDLGVKGSQLPAIAVHGMHRLIVENSPGFNGTDGALSGMFFGCHLGQTQLSLRKTGNLSQAEDDLWKNALVSISSAAVTRGELSWYANGNIAIGYALLMKLTELVTGDLYWRDRFEEAWQNALYPNPVRWSGRGLVIESNGANWKDNSGSQQVGYLTEEGAYGVGFDTDYSGFDLSQLGRLYLLTKDWRVGRLLRIIWNKLSPLIDDADLIDMSVGTRHPHPGAKWEFVSVGLPVVASLGDERAKTLLPLWWGKVLNSARYPLDMNSAGRYDVGLKLSALPLRP